MGNGAEGFSFSQLIDAMQGILSFCILGNRQM